MVNQIVKYFEGRPEVVAAYLFGSRARGLEKQYSDIDLGVLVENDVLSDQNDLRTDYAVGLARILRKDLHIVVMNNVGEGILEQIFRHGKCVFDRNPGILSRFKMVRYSMVADFGYHRNLMEKAFVSKILGDDQ